jgi:phosphatidylglycerophosphatase A
LNYPIPAFAGMTAVLFWLMQKPDLKQPHILLCTWFGCGLLRPGPGTWGTLGGLPFGIFLAVMGGWKALLAGTIIVTLLGWLVADKFEKETQTHDSSQIVIDEVAGVWLTLLAAPLSPLSVVASFILFRFFDILKPFPVSWCDRKIAGGLGVMVDDLAAALYAGLCLYGLHRYGFV